jgi:two-component system LytT family response regulator
MTKKLTAMIVDDERLARNEIRDLLVAHSQIKIIAEAADVPTALSLVEAQKPQLLFLDIKLGRESGFELVNRLVKRPRIIFITAYDEFAVRAFEIHAIDYLLKPVNPVRLTETINRLCTEMESIRPNHKLEYDERLFIRINNQTQFLKISEIRFIQSAGDYSELFFSEGKCALILIPLKRWEENLPSKYFIRIHRSTIMNLEYVERIEEWFHQSYRIYLKNISDPLAMSRRYAARLKRRF